MEYRTRNRFDGIAWLLLNGLVWVGAVGLAWELFKPAGWLFGVADFILREQPTGFYYLGLGIAALLTGKIWLDSVDPRAFHNLLIAVCAFAGTLFMLRPLLPL